MFLIKQVKEETETHNMNEKTDKTELQLSSLETQKLGQPTTKGNPGFSFFSFGSCQSDVSTYVFGSSHSKGKEISSVTAIQCVRKKKKIQL